MRQLVTLPLQCEYSHPSILATSILATLGDFIYLVSSWAHLLHTYNLDFGDFDFGDLNFDRSKKSPK